jgi:SAM-dependent methyltransferase
VTTSEFDQLAYLYERSFDVWPYRRDVEQYSVLVALGDITGLKALDLGCGSGAYTRLLAEHGARPVVGVDQAAGMIEHAQRLEAERPCGASFVLQDAEDVGVPMAGSYDLVLAVHLLPYASTVDGLRAMCATAYGALAGRGGRFVTVTINPEFATEPHYYQRYGFDLSVRSGELADGDPVRLRSEFLGGVIDVTPHYWSRATQENSLRAAGFQQVTWWDPLCAPTADLDHFAAYLRTPPTLVITATVWFCTRLSAAVGASTEGEVVLVQESAWMPTGLDPDIPSAARVYDYFLGGYHNLAADREFAARATRTMPDLPVILRTSRRFLRRAVHYLLDAGVRQFLDLGSGIPTAGNVHEIAQAAAPESRVVYVDRDSIAIAHSDLMLESNDRAAALLADLRFPDDVLHSDVVTTMLDLTRPVAVLMSAVLHFVESDTEARAIVAAYRNALAPGGYVVISQGTQETAGEQGEQVIRLYNQTDSPFTARDRQQFTDLFHGLELVKPGVVYVSQWRPDTSEDIDEHPERSCAYGAIGRKPLF